MTTDWTRHKIRYELAKKGFLSLLALDAKNGFVPMTVSNAIREPHKEGEQAIAKVLKVHASQIWPSRYDKDGNRLRPQPATNYRRRNPKCKSQKGAQK